MLPGSLEQFSNCFVRAEPLLKLVCLPDCSSAHSNRINHQTHIVRTIFQVIPVVSIRQVHSFALHNVRQRTSAVNKTSCIISVYTICTYFSKLCSCSVVNVENSPQCAITNIKYLLSHLTIFSDQRLEISQ